MKNQSSIVTLLLLSLFLWPACAAGKEISIPITLDYELLDALIVGSYYTAPDKSAEIINEGNGCIELTLSDPHFSGGDGMVKLRSSLFLHVGTPLGNTCMLPYEWQGGIEIEQIPRLDSNWDLQFETTRTTLFNQANQKIESLDIVFDQLLPHVNNYMRDFSIRLAGPVQDLRTFILPMFTIEAQYEAEALLDSIRPGAVSISEQQIIVTLLADARSIDQTIQASSPDFLSDDEIDAFLELWETWDSLLVYLIGMLVDQPLSPEEKQQLINLVLDTRYELVTTINDRSIQKDFVRDQFMKGWQLISKIFRNHLLQNPTRGSLGYLSFITAGDALMILDELGPAFGVEVSRDGLIRLARILGGESVDLRYAPGTNKALQQLFDIEPENDGPPPEEPPAPGSSPHSSFFNLFRTIEDFVIPAAHAAPLPSFSEIKRWQPPKRNNEEYLGRVRKLLNTAVTSLVVRKQISEQLVTIYRDMIPAIAWQESCFKQFVVKNQKLTYLLSYNNSSVGLMQVNERVWRGMYNMQRLRWDISYNASAGSEIADLYLQRYVLPKYGKKILSNPELLARLVYAMYNGGPSQYEKFLQRDSSGKLYDSDRLFATKYEWVRNQAWDNTSRCF